MKKKIDLLYGKCSHREYYAQYSHIFDDDVEMWDAEYLAKCLEEDEHLNNIPLYIWDDLSRRRQHELFDMSFKIEGERVWSLSMGVCAAKEAARQRAEKYNQKGEKND